VFIPPKYGMQLRLIQMREGRLRVHLTHPVDQIVEYGAVVTSIFSTATRWKFLLILRSLRSRREEESTVKKRLRRVSAYVSPLISSVLYSKADELMMSLSFVSVFMFQSD
jgi:hypothetical protein